MGWMHSTFRTTKDMNDADEKKIPKGSSLISVGYKKNMPVFRNLENGKQHRLRWNDIHLTGAQRNMYYQTERIIPIP